MLDCPSPPSPLPPPPPAPPMGEMTPKSQAMRVVDQLLTLLLPFGIHTVAVNRHGGRGARGYNRS